jgi:polysaccharide deacetylase 2 family uncharacterized protein YibQ
LKRARVSAATVFFAVLSLVLAIALFVKSRPAPPAAPQPPRPRAGDRPAARLPGRALPRERDSVAGIRETTRERTTQPSFDQSIRGDEGRPRLAILVDDLGNDEAAVDRIASWRFPISVAILPALPGSSRAARHLEQSGKEVLLHLPMEPKGYPEVRPGPGVVLTSQSDQEIVQVLESDLASVPGAVGVNNHMGSVATADPRVMKSIADVLARRGLFFVDSRTTDATVARDAAERAGVRSASRRVFLDDAPAEDAIRRQLDQAVARARAEGSAIAIGHPHASTLAVLQREMPRLAGEVRLVRVGELVK